MITFFLHPSSKSIIDHIICIDLTTLKPHSYIMIIWSHIWTKTTHRPVNNDMKCKRYPTVLIIYTQLGKKLIYLILKCHCQTDSGISKSARLMSKVAIFHKICAKCGTYVWYWTHKGHPMAYIHKWAIWSPSGNSNQTYSKSWYEIWDSSSWRKSCIIRIYPMSPYMNNAHGESPNMGWWVQYDENLCNVSLYEKRT